MNKYLFGAWVWGVLGAVAIVIGIFFVFNYFDQPAIIAPVLAILIATLGIVWSWFFQLAQKEQHHRDFLDLQERKIINEKVER